MGTPGSDVSLRVLYTVNTSPQYILAKAPHGIAFVPTHSTSSPISPPKHGRASIKTCALAICRSSPELRPDATKDFSVYVLDPLEDVASNSRLRQAGGVAVGMGLLSGILSPYMPDTTMVNGTFVACGQTEDALEVVMSLRQVTPSVIHGHGVNEQSQIASSGPKGKSALKRSLSEQPYLTSNPLSLPSLDERIFASYTQPNQCEQQATRPKELRKPNPAHATRAHQLPTPYIGPPKRKYVRESERSKEQMTESSLGKGDLSELSDMQNSVTCEGANNGGTAEPTSSQTSTCPDVGRPAPFVQPCTSNGTPDMSEAAVMLAALSAVSSGAPGSAGNSTIQGNGQPNPELVSFLRIYLALLESQQQQAESNAEPECTSSTSQQPMLPSRSPMAVEATSSHSMMPPSAQNKSVDKENQKPNPAQEALKNEKTKCPINTSPLGGARFNARTSEAQLSTAENLEQPTPLITNTAMATAQQEGERPRKRKLSNALSEDQSSQTRRRSPSTSKSSPAVDNLNGIRVNTGWGGLRVMSDGSMWGEHPPRSALSAAPSASSSGPKEQPFVFRSSAKVVPTAPIRKGPYIVPDWAKGVPPPSPPHRPESSVEDRKKAKKQSKAKGLGRLGGRSSVKRVPSTTKAPDAPTTPPRNTQEGHSASANLCTSPKRTPEKRPIFAYSSPVGKSAVSTLFQAIQTSPCRPTSTRKTIYSTPARQTNLFPSGSAHQSSLFTPSPLTARDPASVSRHGDLFTGEEPPPSPTPTKRRPANSEVLTSRQDLLTPGSSEPVSISQGEGTDPPSSLPVASSDDILDDNSLQAPSMSSDSTIANPNKIHDWSFLDLPPSSPPLPSSPSLLPMEGSDLPCFDIPSDLSEVESPSVIAFDIDNSEHPSHEHQVEMRNSDTIASDLVFSPSLVSSNEGMSEAFGVHDDALFYMTGEEGPVTAAVEALDNGLGQEDFSEAWDFLQSMFDQYQVTQDARTNNGEPDTAATQSWISEDPAFASGIDFNSSFAFAQGSDSQALTSGPSAITQAVSAVAANFEDILKGCVV
ncbi:uncharacterized protein FOMMEDRAFT_167557 [Fomitiporia mediterranea MF3/22]|uniref:uncharacterized protein n=1 Tax=Fomitiporia mediterranea (strain MF3/22) TaxID=694068 RepID=UPI00044078E6|nr:uncharacterized protein FOMMEDRAFT_167557 [Fomitiporia mediterranea MF3/22]EJD04353.1 hypothetical protein FOMMEDRAFT_167557 [Fomitiporia mediterranea MF3/22]